MTIKIGSLFAGIGGFELGLERSWVNAETIWQVEREEFCQKILQKHWPKSTLYNDVRDIKKHNIEPVDVLIGGFPCQDISLAGKQRGVNNGEKSSLWWEMWRIASDLRPRIIIMENVANIIRLGGVDVIGSLAQIGYDCEWTVISARQFGAPHLRERWFCVAYSNLSRRQKQHESIMLDTSSGSRCGDSQIGGIQSGDNYWNRAPYPSPFCRVDDGISNRVARLKALGNAIVPQCSQWVGDQILKSGLLNDLLEDK
jgi:DNA (cytosine-5)-methyltransferase 1